MDIEKLFHMYNQAYFALKVGTTSYMPEIDFDEMSHSVVLALAASHAKSDMQPVSKSHFSDLIHDRLR